MKGWHFEEKIYKRWLTFVICPHEEFVEAMRQLHYVGADDLPRTEGSNVRLTYENSDVSCTYIWMPKLRQAQLAHELLHFVLHTFDRNGVPIEYGNEEVMAYYLEYWVREINRVYKKYPNGRTVAEAKRS